jgi:hypothetical protein
MTMMTIELCMSKGGGTTNQPIQNYTDYTVYKYISKAYRAVTCLSILIILYLTVM